MLQNISNEGVQAEGRNSISTGFGVSVGIRMLYAPADTGSTSSMPRRNGVNYSVNRGVFLPGYASGEEEQVDEPPPRYPHSALSTPNLGTSRTRLMTPSTGQDEDAINPPPNYTECTFPPPTYDDLYERILTTPKSVIVRSKIEVAKRFIPCFCVICIATMLLAVGVKHVVLKSCENRRFLEIWCISTAAILYISMAFLYHKPLRVLLTKIEHFLPILIYMATVFTVSWFIGGLIYSWDQLRDDRCDLEIPRASFAACVFIFCFLVIFCCCGRDIFHQNRTRPD